MIHLMLHGGPSDGAMYSFRRHHPPRELRTSRDTPTGTDMVAAHNYILVRTDEFEGTVMHKQASYQYAGDRQSHGTLINFWE